MATEPQEDLPRTFWLPCPLCDRPLWFTMGEGRPVHAEPSCARFAAMSDLEFVICLAQHIEACACGQRGDA